MKKFFTLIAVALMAFAAQANELTVCDGEYTSTYLPIFGLYTDTEGTLGQTIYTADMLTEMQNGEISQLKFYTPGIKFSGATLQLSLKVVDQTDFADYNYVTDPVAVATCTPEVDATELVFDLDEPFLYEGGNLMAEVKVIATGQWATTYFYGVETEYASGYYQYQYSWSDTPSKFTTAFMPKATFAFETGENPPVDPVEGKQVIFIDQNGEEHAYDLYPSANNPNNFVTMVDLDYDPFGQFDIVGGQERPNVPLYFLVDGVRYGAPEYDMTPVVMGMMDETLQNPLIGSEFNYCVPVGYTYTIGMQLALDGNLYVICAQGGMVGVDELNADKAIAGVRYFNMAGQEMQEANGMTIVVTTYTDGTSSAVKVMK